MIPGKRLSVFIGLVLITTQFLPSPGFASQIENKRQTLEGIQQKITENKKKLQTTESRQAALMRQIDAIDQRILSSENAIAHLKRSLSKTVKERNAIKGQVDALRKRLSTAQRELDAANAKLDLQTNVLDNRIRSVYKSGNLGYVEALFGSASFSDFLNHLSYLQMIVSQDGKIVEEIKQTKESIENKKASIERDGRRVVIKWRALLAQENKISSLRAEQESRRRTAQAELQKQQVLLAKVEKEKASYENAEDVLLSASASVTAQIRALEESAKHRRHIAASRGVSRRGFVRPTSGPITSGFGPRFHPVLRTYKMHTGVDFGTPTGTPIVAAMGGTVIEAGWVRGYGQTVIISHGDGLSTLYAHASALLVSAGQSVQAGQLIARVGETGLTSGPNLHFEVRVNGEPRNPMGWL